MALPQYLTRGNSSSDLQFRRRIPDHLQAALEGRREITCSLGAGSVNVAARLARGLGVQFDRGFAEAEAKLKTTSAAPEYSPQLARQAITSGELEIAPHVTLRENSSHLGRRRTAQR